MSSDAPNTPSSPSCRTRAATPSCKPADACFCRSLTASKQSLTTTEKSSPLTPKSQPRWGRYAILPSLTTRGNVASTNIRTASSDSTSKKVQTSLCCLMPMSKGSRINSTRALERYSAIRHLARVSPTPRLCVLHFAVEWAREFRPVRVKIGRIWRIPRDEQAGGSVEEIGADQPEDGRIGQAQRLCDAHDERIAID